MIFKLNVNTEIELKTVQDLNKLRLVMEVNGLDKPNFSELARRLGVDRRTVKKYYEGNIEINRKPKKSKIDDYYDLISSLLSAENRQIFYYKSHLYRYLVREHNLECSRSNFNYFILKNNEFAEYFKPKGKRCSKIRNSIWQAQFDWKEKLNFTFKDGSEMLFNVGSLVLSASRFKVWTICPSTNQTYLFDFLDNAFETLGGVPSEILIYNAPTMMDKARTERSDGKINPKFQQLADDFGFKIVPCIRTRPNTKAKVENPMRIIDEIMIYNGMLENMEELYEKMNLITNEANSRVCQATGLPPILVFNTEKDHLLPLPHAKVCSYYKNITIEVIECNLNVYYNKKLITVHSISENIINYHSNHHLQMLGLTFKGQEDEDIKDYAEKHFKELEKFNEQLSTVTTKST